MTYRRVTTVVTNNPAGIVNSHNNITKNVVATQPSSATSDPQRLIKATNQIAQVSDLSLPELEERIKAGQAELSTIQYEIEKLKREEQEARQLVATINKDKDSFLELKEEMGKAGIEPTDSPRFLNVIHAFKKYNYDPSKIMGAFAEVMEVEDVKRLKEETNGNRRALDTMLSTLGVGLDQLKQIIVSLMTLEDLGVDVEQIINLCRTYPSRLTGRDMDRLRRQEWERKGREWGNWIQENNGGGGQEYDYGYTDYPF
jgi:hypothetical protein